MRPMKRHCQPGRVRPCFRSSDPCGHRPSTTTTGPSGRIAMGQHAPRSILALALTLLASGARAGAGAPPDGYTLLAGNTSTLAVGPAVSASAGYDPVKNFAPIAKVSESYQILVVHPSRPWKTVKDLVEYSKANPGALNFAHTGAGGLPHLTGELFMARSGAKLTGVPFRSGGEAVTAVLSEAVHLTFESITILLPLIREGKVRALAITSSKRTPLAPELPTMIEAGVPD